MADNTKLLLFGGAAVAVWWFYLRTPPTAVISTATAAPATVPPTTGTTATTGANTLAAIEARVIVAAKAPPEGYNVDQWDWFLNNELAPLGKVAPDPLPLFQAAIPGFDRSQKLTSTQYWPVMEAALKSQLGMSGLGFYGGLSAIASRYRH